MSVFVAAGRGVSSMITLRAIAKRGPLVRISDRASKANNGEGAYA